MKSSHKMIWRSFYFLIPSMFILPAFAGDINWSGRYLIESHLLKNPNLGSSARELSDLSHHLVLSPHMIAGDGLKIQTRFDIFNNTNYPNSQVGEFFGGSTTANNNKVNSGSLDDETIAVTELYLTWTQQFGSLIAGRAPLQFGLGITHNAGLGEYDHWFDREDMIGYKLVAGNLYFIPMYGKVKEGNPENDDDIRDYMLQVTYENLDTDLEMGGFYQSRKANPGGIDTSSLGPDGIFNQTASAAATAASVYDVKTYNLYVKKKTGNFKVSLEASMQSGSTGLYVAGEEIEVDASAIIAEVVHERESSKWKCDVKLGVVSGDDPTTLKYEGYLVDRNYDVALLMFNYRLGSVSGRGAIGSENYINALTGGNNQADVGQISNTMYFAPGFSWKWNEKWGMNGRFTYAQLQEEQYDNQSSDIGYELDLGVYYRPYERFSIKLDAGYLWAGDAFKGDPTAPVEIDNAYGIMTKASVSF